MKKLLVGGAIGAGLLGGSIALTALSPLGSAIASNQQATTVQAGQAPDTTAPAQGQQGQGQQGPQGQGARKGKLGTALDDLVKDGTITQDQADKIKAKVQSLFGDGMPGHPIAKAFHEGLDTAAKTIGISAQDLRNELMSGKSIADVAREHNVDVQKVIDDLTAAVNARIDQAVGAGTIPADKANEIKSHVTEGVTRLVNAKHDPNAPKGPGGHGRRGPHGGNDNNGRNGNGNGGTPAPSTPPTTG